MGNRSVLNGTSIASAQNSTLATDNSDFLAWAVAALFVYVALCCAVVCVGPCLLCKGLLRIFVCISPVWPDPQENLCTHALFGTVAGGGLASLLSYTDEAAEYTARALRLCGSHAIEASQP